MSGTQYDATTALAAQLYGHQQAHGLATAKKPAFDATTALSSAMAQVTQAGSAPSTPTVTVSSAAPVVNTASVTVDAGKVKSEWHPKRS